MNKYLRFLWFFLLIIPSLATYSQCVPGNYIKPGIYPDSASGFPPAVATYNYNLTVTVVVPKDTILFPLPRLPIDSIGVVQIQGLPSGFLARPNRPSGFWKGGTAGCMLISGKPTKQQVGKHPLLFKVVGYIGGIGLPIPYDVTFYSITVLDSAAYGIFSPAEYNALKLNAFPNPVRETLTLEFYSEKESSLSLLIYDMLGRLALSDNLTSSVGVNFHSVSTSKLSPGVYICRIIESAGQRASAIRFTKH